ncbi:TetR/AcrR family transcriptional regulator [Kitasatospora sp. NPDC097605]|uniref:TetR/AcrR family transcriptional regulator n=1 Tax=Kitasatospora sp. NPDC097605 TaxID=3157226 RepID=UPI00332AD34C
MANRSSTPKGRAQRERALAAAFEVFAREGERGTSLRAIARESGMSLTGLMHHFASKDELLTEVLRGTDELAALRWDALAGAGDPGEFMARVMEANAANPARTRLYVHLAASSLDPGHPAHRYFRERFERFRAAVRGHLEARRAEGSVSAGLDADFTAAAFLALVEGAQLQGLNDPSVDVPGLVRRGWRALLAGPVS